jgi:hypothetical protein
MCVISLCDDSKMFRIASNNFFFFLKLCIDWLLNQFNIIMGFCGIISECGTYRSVLMVEGFILCITVSYFIPSQS